MMGKGIPFTLDGVRVQAQEGETIWAVARRLGVFIPHLCHHEAPGYRADGNCRACMVEIEGERVLAASCIRHPLQGMAVHTKTARASKARKMVMELLLADQPPPARTHDSAARFRAMAEAEGVSHSRFPPLPPSPAPAPDRTHLAMGVDCGTMRDASICGLGQAAPNAIRLTIRHFPQEVS